MIDRRTMLAGGIAVGIARTAYAGGADAKTRAMDSISLPPGFNGVLAHGRNGEVEHLRHAGLADVEAGVPITAATQFRWGSGSKWVTSVAALRLVEQGRLDLDAPIGRYLPGLPAATGGRVRLWHLLSNTSGIPDLLTRQVAIEPELRTAAASPAAMAARYAGGPLQFAPGEGWDYAALNWVLVAAILEQAAGASLPDLVARLVFAPLGMTRTGFAQANRSPLPALAAAYAGPAPAQRKMAPVPPFLAASGTVAGTAADAIRAAHGICHGPLLRAASRRALTMVRWPAEEYALGGRVHAVGGDRWAWQTGKVQGYRAHIAHRLAASETIVVFNTTDLPQATLAQWVEQIALG